MDRAFRLAGLILTSAGLALIAGAFALPRLIDGAVPPRWLALVGFPCIGAGLVLARRHWQASLRPALAVIAVVAPAVVSLAVAHQVVSARPSLDDLELVAAEFPGFTLSLPVHEAPAAPRYAVGSRDVGVAGLGGRILVRWLSMGPMSDAELRRNAELRAAPARMVELLPVNPGTDPSFVGMFDRDGRFGITATYCSDAGQFVIIATGLESTAGEITRFHTRVSRSLRCGEGPPADQREVLVPRFAVPAVGHVGGSQPSTFLGADGSTYTFQLTFGDATREFAERPETLADMVRAMGAAVVDGSIRSQTRDGRHYVSVVAAAGGGRLRVTAVTFYCPDLDVSFFARHEGSVAVAAELAVADLARAGCPAGSEPPVSVRAAFRAACRDGHGWACYRLATGVASGVLEPDGLDPNALAARACELGVEPACPPPRNPP